MAICINNSGTYRNITTLCVNDSGTYRNITVGFINDSGTYRLFGFLPPLGSSYEGGFLICRSGGIQFIVSPYSAEVSRSWHSRNDANTTAQAASGCTGWFVPGLSQLQSPGFACRSFWGPSPCYSSTNYWSSLGHGNRRGCFVDFTNGNASHTPQPATFCVRAFRCVTY